MPSSPDVKSRNWAISVPATKALLPAPRNTATLTPSSLRMRAQIAPSCSYMRHVIALRASGRSKVTVAAPPSQTRRTSPSLIAMLPEYMSLHRLDARDPRDGSELAQLVRRDVPQPHAIERAVAAREYPILLHPLVMEAVRHEVEDHDHIGRPRCPAQCGIQPAVHGGHAIELLPEQNERDQHDAEHDSLAVSPEQEPARTAVEAFFSGIGDHCLLE